jgi:hypothetical protein
MGATTMLTTEVKRGVESGPNRYTHVVTTEHDTREFLASA